MVNPCMSLMSSFNIEVTNLCCLTRDKSRNFSEAILTSNMEPQPPEMSLTETVVGKSFSVKRFVMRTSSSVDENARLKAPRSVGARVVVLDNIYSLQINKFEVSEASTAPESTRPSVVL